MLFEIILAGQIGKKSPKGLGRYLKKKHIDLHHLEVSSMNGLIFSDFSPMLFHVSVMLW